MNDVEIEERVRGALRIGVGAAVAARPDEADVHRRVARRVRRRRATGAVASVAAVLVALGLFVVVRHGSGDDREGSGPRPAGSAAASLVFQRGRDLVDGNGATIVTLPGSAELLDGAAGHVIAADASHTYLYDLAHPDQPVVVPSRPAMGVALTDTGYWSAAPGATEAEVLVWQFRTWRGDITGSTVKGGSELVPVVPVGGLDQGVALWNKNDGHVVSTTYGRTYDIGRGVGVAAGGSLIALVMADFPDRVVAFDMGTLTAPGNMPLSTGLRPAQNTRAGAYSPDETWLAVALAHDDPASSPAGTLLSGPGGQVTVLPIMGVAVRWTTDSHAVVVGTDSLSVVDPAHPRRVRVIARPAGVGGVTAVVGPIAP